MRDYSAFEDEEIEICEQNDEENPAPPLVTNKITINSPTGLIVVHHSGNSEHPCIIALSDMGLNHRTCFGGLVSQNGFRRAIQDVFFLQVDLCGSWDDAENVESVGVPEKSDKYPSPTPFDGLLEQITAVLNHFKITRFIGMGLGAGGTLLVTYASLFPSSVRGLILMSASANLPGWATSVYKWIGTFTLSMWGITDRVKDNLIQRFFSPQAIEENSDLVEGFSAELDKINPANLRRFINAYMSRTHKLTSNLKELRVSTLFIYGRDAYYHDDIIDLASNFNPSYVETVEIAESGNLVTEEAPHQLTKPICLYLAGRGIGPKTN